MCFVTRMSTRVLLATLSIPITPERTDIARLLDMDGIIVEKQRRLATLLGLQAPPTRASLINDMVGTGLQVSSLIALSLSLQSTLLSSVTAVLKLKQLYG